MFFYVWQRGRQKLKKYKKVGKSSDSSVFFSNFASFYMRRNCMLRLSLTNNKQQMDDYHPENKKF